ncbi:MAG: HAD-IA family hydrolase [Phycisphaera sp.]|nr:HAD-IA family hydrolase [Phycisphaera sp.]
MPSAIIFDFDGVIVDSERLHYLAFLRVMERYAFTFDFNQYLTRYVGFDDRDGFRALLADAGQRELTHDQPLIRELCLEKARAFERVVHEGVTAIPGAVELVKEAHAQQLPIAIASGATREDIDLILHALALKNHFRAIVSANDVARSKPDPTTYRMALERLNITAHNAVALEDTAAGIESARGAGLRVLGVGTLNDPSQLTRAHRSVQDLRSVTVSKLREWFG